MPISEERLQSIARRVVRECARVKAGEDVYIEGRADAVDYLELLAFECELVGARPLLVMTSDAYQHRRLTELPHAQIATRAAGWIEAVKKADVVFTVRMEDGDPALFADVTPEQRAAGGRGRKLLADHIYDGSRRWIGTDYPTPQQAAAFGLDYEAYQAMFWDALDLDYAELKAHADRVAGLLDGAQTVHISSPKGTDVTLGIAGRPLDKDYGVTGVETQFSNLPAGEVCLAPLEDGMDGTVVFDLAFWDGRRIEDLEIRFDAGKAHPVGAKTEFDYFRGVLESSDGDADVIGELGIGLNPNVGEPTGYTLTDEKILGTVHLALGENEMLGGINKSTLHWDMMVLRPSVEVDGTPLLIDGEMQV
jgi:aminopeptidase